MFRDCIKAAVKDASKEYSDLPNFNELVEAHTEKVLDFYEKLFGVNLRL